MPYKDEAARKAYHKKYHAKWYEENKEKRSKQIIEYQKTKPEGWQKAIGRKCHLKQRYNVTPQEYESMLEAQKYKCAICGKKAEDNKRGIAFISPSSCLIIDAGAPFFFMNITSLPTIFLDSAISPPDLVNSLPTLVGTPTFFANLGL
jgi:hypothetical protein